MINYRRILPLLLIPLLAVVIGVIALTGSSSSKRDSRANAARQHRHHGQQSSALNVSGHGDHLVGCRPTGATVVYHGSRTAREVALTFDDGPWGTPPTIDFVDELHKLGAVGTFFEIGSQIARYDPTGAVERKMLADGDMIGDHTWSHPDMLRLSTERQLQELEWERDVVKQKTGFTECLFRPPYAYFNNKLTSLARSIGMTTIQWDVDTADWALPGVAKIVATAVDHARDGSIIIMHFGGGDRNETLTALPEMVSRLRAQGYKFVTITDLLGYKLIYRSGSTTTS